MEARKENKRRKSSGDWGEDFGTAPQLTERLEEASTSVVQSSPVYYIRIYTLGLK